MSKPNSGHFKGTTGAGKSSSFYGDGNAIIELLNMCS